MGSKLRAKDLGHPKRETREEKTGLTKIQVKGVYSTTKMEFINIMWPQRNGTYPIWP